MWNEETLNGVINHNVRAKNIQQREQVIVACLKWSCGKHYDSICVIAEIFGAFISEGFVFIHTTIADMMCFIYNDKIKMHRGIQIHQPKAFLLFGAFTAIRTII